MRKLSHLDYAVGPVAAATRSFGGAIIDTNVICAIVEAERGIANAWGFETEVRWFLDVDQYDPPLGAFRRGSFITLRLTRYL